MNKEKTPKVKTIQINYPAPYYHHSWSEETEQKKKRLAKKLVAPYKSKNEVSTAPTGRVSPNNPYLTLEKAAKKLEKLTKENQQSPKSELKKTPKKRESKNNNVILIKESPEGNSPKPRKRSPRADSPHLKYGLGVFKKPRGRGQSYLQMDKRKHRIGTIPHSTHSPVMMYRASPAPRLAVSETVHLDIKPRQASPHWGQGAAVFSWRGATKAS